MDRDIQTHMSFGSRHPQYRTELAADLLTVNMHIRTEEGPEIPLPSSLVGQYQASVNTVLRPFPPHEPLP